jgi:porin
MRLKCKALAAVTGVLALVLTNQAHADEAPDLKRDLADAGIDLGLSLTEFVQSAVAGDGGSDWKIGGKIDATLGLDGNRLGLWPGLTVSIHQEWVHGDDVNDQGDGSLLPVNVAMGFPRLGGDDAETAVVLTQSFDVQVSVSLGKFNMLDAAARTPLIGGGGISTFSHVGLAAPISGVTPPYLLGAMGTVRTDALITTVMIYDPRNAQDSKVLEAPFEDGVTVSLSATKPVTFLGGKPGFQGLRAVYSSQRGLDLNDIPQLALPPEAEAVIGEKSGYWYLAYSFQQYLSYNAGKGWGVYGQAAISDGNPNTIESSLLAGVGGDSPLANRTDDRWGLGYFRYNLSSRLLDGLQAVGINNLRHEQGLEAFYSLAVLETLRLTASLNYIAPGNSDRDDALFTGLRFQARF